MSEKRRLTTENWSSFLIEDLELTDDQRAWNHYAVMKQLELNTMLRGFNYAKDGGIDSLSSAYTTGDGGTDSDPLPDS